MINESQWWWFQSKIFISITNNFIIESTSRSSTNYTILQLLTFSLPRKRPKNNNANRTGIKYEFGIIVLTRSIIVFAIRKGPYKGRSSLEDLSCINYTEGAHPANKTCISRCSGTMKNRKRRRKMERTARRVNRSEVYSNLRFSRFPGGVCVCLGVWRFSRKVYRCFNVWIWFILSLLMVGSCGGA